MRKVVIPLHGIRTHARWQRAFVDVAQNRGFLCPLDNWDFGRFSLLSFLLPKKRDAKIQWFRSRYNELMTDRNANLGVDNYPSVIAHSFGTYIVGYALFRYRNMKFDKIILCGSILPRSFPWQQIIERGQVREIRNEYGSRDIWVRLVKWFVRGAGSSGQDGFDTSCDRVTQEQFVFSHSEYFDKGHMDALWMDFLLRPSAPASYSPSEEAHIQAQQPIPLPASPRPIGTYGALLLVVGVVAGIIPWSTSGFWHSGGKEPSPHTNVPTTPSPTEPEIALACYSNLPGSAEEFSLTRVCLSGQIFADVDPLDVHSPGIEIRKVLSGRDIVDIFVDVDSVWVLASRWTARRPIPDNPDGSLFPYREMSIIHIKSLTDIAVNDGFTVKPVTYRMPDAIIYKNQGNIECFINYLDPPAGDYKMVGGLYRFNPLTLYEVSAESLFPDRNWGWYPQFVDGQIKHWSSEGGYYWVLNQTPDKHVDPVTAQQEFKVYLGKKSAGLLPTNSRARLIGGIIDLFFRKFQ